MQHSLVSIITNAIEDIKGKDIVCFDVSHKTKMFDHVMICSAGSYVQVRAIANHVAEEVKRLGSSVKNIEGLDSAEWVLVDCIDVIVHVMLPPIRSYYYLEELWGH